MSLSPGKVYIGCSVHLFIEDPLNSSLLVSLSPGKVYIGCSVRLFVKVRLRFQLWLGVFVHPSYEVYSWCCFRFLVEGQLKVQLWLFWGCFLFCVLLLLLFGRTPII